MSTLKVTNIQATGETASRAVSGIAAAWVNYNGYTSTARDSLNVSSLTDHAAGQHSTNFTSNMNNANYSLPAQVSYDLTGATPTDYTPLTVKQGSGQSTTSSCRVNTAYANTAGGSVRDMDIVCLAILGDLA